MLTHIRNYFPANFYSSDKMMHNITKSLIILCLMIFHSTKKNNLLIVLSLGVYVFFIRHKRLTLHHLVSCVV